MHEQQPNNEPVEWPPEDDTGWPTGEPTKEQQPVSPHVWIGSTVDIDEGVQHGAWLNAAQSPEELQEKIDELLARSPHTARTGEAVSTWQIRNQVGFGSVRLDAHRDDLDWVTEVARGIREHGPVFSVWATLMDGHGPLDDFAEAFLGDYPDPSSWARELCELRNLSKRLEDAVPPGLLRYIRVDVGSMSADAQLSGAITVADNPAGGVWIFAVPELVPEPGEN